jgi:phenylpropionate dioxygenase-like ring-hydroxylating dioxygenase large terminal subunit
MSLLTAKKWTRKCSICGAKQIALTSQYGILWVCPNEEHRSEWVRTRLQDYIGGDTDESG